ncbi:ATP-binding protein [Catenovulum sediminis]|uniref:histidine kinase n=1 Tax=Catenovulum sediminis TaxID=1740262 RepID=A0ABV1RMJ2_9ALTE
MSLSVREAALNAIKKHIKSLSFQIISATLVLVMLLILVVSLLFEVQKSYSNNLVKTQETLSEISLVRQVERDLVDLQRNVLIYKDTASESAIKRFHELQKDIQQNLTQLSKQKQTPAFLDYVARMQAHLTDYNTNFITVIDNRTRRQELVHQSLTPGFKAITQSLFELLQQYPEYSKNWYLIDEAIKGVKDGQLAALNYFVSPDYLHLTTLKSSFKTVFKTLASFEEPEKVDEIHRQLLAIQKNFLTVTHITRGYIFLVNVVMAGTANEFLYLSQQLSQLEKLQFTATANQVQETLAQQKKRAIIISFIAIGIAILIAIFFVMRVSRPIIEITQIFSALSQDKTIGEITHKHRQDEVGLLARAADAFQAKIRQTKELLLQSQSLNLALSESKREAEEATIAKSRFLANMSHEIRTPINGILGLVKLTLETNLTTKQKEYLENAQYSSKLLLNIISDILDFSKIEAGKLGIEHSKFSFEEFLQGVIVNVQSQPYETDIKVVLDVAPDIPQNMIGDSLRLTQIVTNLVNNSLKFTEKGEVKISFYGEHLESGNYRLYGSVKDTGIGIPRNKLDTIFSSFTQVDNSTSRQYGGTGLGLPIVRELCALMGGRVAVESELEQGSCFRFDIMLEVVIGEKTVLQEVATDQSSVFTVLSAGGASCVKYLAALGYKFTEVDFDAESRLSDDKLPAIIELPVLTLSQSDLERVVHDKNGCLVISPEKYRLALEAIFGLDNPLLLFHPYSPKQWLNAIEQLFVNQVEHTAQITPEADKESNLNFDDCSVLIVEDNEINQLVAAAMLERYGVSVEVAENGKVAVDKLLQDPNKITFDLILMDVQMPVMDGYEATRVLRQKGLTSLPIIGLSANALQSDYDAAKQAGMNEYLTKPIDEQKLEQTLCHFLAHKMCQ